MLPAWDPLPLSIPEAREKPLADTGRVNVVLKEQINQRCSSTNFVAQTQNFISIISLGIVESLKSLGHSGILPDGPLQIHTVFSIFKWSAGLLFSNFPVPDADIHGQVLSFLTEFCTVGV